MEASAGWWSDSQGPGKVVWGIGIGEKGRGLSHPAASLKVWWTTLISGNQQKGPFITKGLHVYLGYCFCFLLSTKKKKNYEAFQTH